MIPQIPQDPYNSYSKVFSDERIPMLNENPLKFWFCLRIHGDASNKSLVERRMAVLMIHRNGEWQDFMTVREDLAWVLKYHDNRHVCSKTGDAGHDCWC